MLQLLQHATHSVPAFIGTWILIVTIFAGLALVVSCTRHAITNKR